MVEEGNNKSKYYVYINCIAVCTGGIGTGD
jgi:hypothetical protein